MPAERTMRMPTSSAKHLTGTHAVRRGGALAATARSPERRHPNAVFACDLAKRLAAGHYELPLGAVAARSRGSRAAARARHVAIYLAHVSLGVPLRAVAEEFVRDRSTVAYACRVVEDLRDRPAFDAALAGLELSAQVLLDLARPEQTA